MKNQIMSFVFFTILFLAACKKNDTSNSNHTTVVAPVAHSLFTLHYGNSTYTTTSALAYYPRTAGDDFDILASFPAVNIQLSTYTAVAATYTQNAPVPYANYMYYQQPGQSLQTSEAAFTITLTNTSQSYLTGSFASGDGLYSGSFDSIPVN